MTKKTSAVPFTTKDGIIYRLGYIHLYDSGTGETALIAAMKGCLGVLDSNKLAEIEAWATDKKIHFSSKASNYKIVRELSKELDQLCPHGVYWGLANTFTNYWGFWPDDLDVNSYQYIIARSGLNCRKEVFDFGKAEYCQKSSS